MKRVHILITTTLFTFICCQQIYTVRWVSSRFQGIFEKTVVQREENVQKTEQPCLLKQGFPQCKKMKDYLESGGEAPAGMTADKISGCTRSMTLDAWHTLKNAYSDIVGQGGEMCDQFKHPSLPQDDEEVFQKCVSAGESERVCAQRLYTLWKQVLIPSAHNVSRLRSSAQGLRPYAEFRKKYAGLLGGSGGQPQVKAMVAWQQEKCQEERGADREQVCLQHLAMLKRMQQLHKETA